MINTQGITRIVILIGKYAIKIPNFSCQWDHFLKGLLANMTERDTWAATNDYNKEGLKLLCPVQWCMWGGWVLIMRRCHCISIHTEMQVIDYSPWIEAGYGGDDKPSNYGILDGRIVKIDYA